MFACVCACVYVWVWVCVRFVTFESVRWIINSNLLLILSNFLPAWNYFCVRFLPFFRSTNFSITFFSLLSCLNFPFSIFISIHWLADWLVGCSVGFKSNLLSCAYKLRSAPLFIMHPHQAIFQFHATNYVCVLVCFSKNDCLAYGFITEYRDNPSKDLPSAQWNCVCVSVSCMKQQVYRVHCIVHYTERINKKTINSIHHIDHIIN